MKEYEFKAKGWKCLRCGHKWVSRKKRKPFTCPKCKNVNWDSKKDKKVKNN